MKIEMSYQSRDRMWPGSVPQNCHKPFTCLLWFLQLWVVAGTTQPSVLFTQWHFCLHTAVLCIRRIFNTKVELSYFPCRNGDIIQLTKVKWLGRCAKWKNLVSKNQKAGFQISCCLLDRMHGVFLSSGGHWILKAILWVLGCFLFFLFLFFF